MIRELIRNGVISIKFVRSQHNFADHLKKEAEFNVEKITQEVLNAAAGGIFLYKTPNQAYQLLEDKVLLKLDWAKNQKAKKSLKKTVAFADEGSSNSNTDKIMARMDAMTLKMDAQYKELQNHAKKTKPDEDDILDPNEERPFQNLETKFDRLADKQSGRPSGSLPSNTQPNPKGHNSKAYQPPQSRNEHPLKEKMEAQYGKFLDMIRAVRINVPLIDVLAGMPNYGKFLKELVNNKHKIEQISAAFLSDESLAMIQNKVPPITRRPRKFLIHIADRSFQYPVGIAENMLVEVGKFTFPADFVILEMEEDSKVPLHLGTIFFTL
ncbi:hypothetical protein Tco_0221340 [Tanacetum coccineum]